MVLMVGYALRQSEYEGLLAQEPRTRGFVVFAPESGMLVSQQVIPRKQANSILGGMDAEDIKLYAKIAELERKYVPFWRANEGRGQNLADMVAAHQATGGLLNVFLFMQESMPELYKIERKSGITSATALDLRLLAAEHEVR